MLAQRQPRSVQPLFGIARLGRGNAFTPPVEIAAVDADQDGSLVPLLPEAGSKGPHQWEADLVELEGADGKGVLAHVCGAFGENQYRPWTMSSASSPCRKHAANALPLASRQRSASSWFCARRR